MSFKNWLFNAFLKDRLAYEAYGVIDRALSKKYPEGWPRLLTSLSVGLKTAAVGVVLTSVGAIFGGVSAILGSFGYAAGADLVLYWGAVSTVVLGFVLAVIRYVLYVEATDNDGFLDDDSAVKPPWPTLGPMPTRSAFKRAVATAVSDNTLLPPQAVKDVAEAVTVDVAAKLAPNDGAGK